MVVCATLNRPKSIVYSLLLFPVPPRRAKVGVFQAPGPSVSGGRPLETNETRVDGLLWCDRLAACLYLALSHANIFKALNDACFEHSILFKVMSLVSLFVCPPFPRRTVGDNPDGKRPEDRCRSRPTAVRQFYPSPGVRPTHSTGPPPAMKLREALLSGVRKCA